MTTSYQSIWISKSKRKLIRKRRRKGRRKKIKNEEIMRNIIISMPNLTGAQGRKFRKDERRKARKDGKNVKFVIHKKVGKKIFPSIRKVLSDQHSNIMNDNINQEIDREAQNFLLQKKFRNSYIALDCEMVGIGIEGKISALARVSLIDFSGYIILDTYVKVPSRITNFRTAISGITKRHMKEAMDLNHCRMQVGALIKDKIIVGHALKHDFDALLLSHPKRDVRDTATYRPLMKLCGRNRYRPRKLRDLVKEYVGKDIQIEGKSHDSVEDARSVMELFRVVRVGWEMELSDKLKKCLANHFPDKT